jgi:hypothetical protein
MQGLILGGLVQGVAIHGDAFSGSVFDCFGPIPQPVRWKRARRLSGSGRSMAVLEDFRTDASIRGRGVAVNFTGLPDNIRNGMHLGGLCATGSADCLEDSHSEPDSHNRNDGVRCHYPPYRNRQTVRFQAADCGFVDGRSGNRWAGAIGLSKRRPISVVDMGGIRVEPQPGLPSYWRISGHARSAHLFGLRLLGNSRQDSGEKLGTMTASKRRGLCFVLIYVASVLAFALITALLRESLRLVHGR